MAYHSHVVEITGNAADLDSALETAITGLTITGEPSISAVQIGPSRFMVFILYRDA